MTKREIIALKDAADRIGGWGLFNRKTTEKLAEQGYFEKAQHPNYGNQWRITDAGRAALVVASRGRKANVLRPETDQH
jgi:hypothetical protein